MRSLPDITPDLTDVGADLVASLCLSFAPGGATGNVLIGGTGSYVLTGTPAVTRRGRRTAVTTVGSYALTGTGATVSTVARIVAAPGSYNLTGTVAATIKGGANKVAAATPGAYALTGTLAGTRRGRKVPVTTVGSYGIVGTTVVTGKGLIVIGGSYALTGSQVTPVKTSLPNLSITISVGGNQMLASVGNETVSFGTGLFVFATGNQMLASIGTVAVSAQGSISISVNVTGNQMLASVGNPSVSVVGGVQSVNVTGQAITAYVGDAIGMIPGQAVVNPMPAMTMGVGTVLVERSGSVNVLPIGNYVTMGLGGGTITTSNNIDVTGNEMTASVGSVTGGSNVAATIDSDNNLDISVEVGTVTVSAKQHVSVTLVGNSMVAYVGKLRFVGGGTVIYLADQLKEGHMLRPSNWMGG